MTDRWHAYFDKQGVFQSDWLKTAISHWGFHETLYGMVQRYCPPASRILDVGSGPGWTDVYLAATGYKVTGVDNEDRLVSLASAMAQRLESSVHFEQADAFDLHRYYGRYDFVFSCGVLEHFDRNVTVQLLQEQARCAPRVMIQIPTRYTAYTGEITDERIYTISELRGLVEAAGLTVVAAFGYGDVTVTHFQIWLRRLLPRGLWRWLQNRGFAYSIAVIGVRADAV